MQVLVFLVLSITAFAWANPPPKTLTLGKSFSQTLRVSHLVRAAVANAKVAKVKAIPPSSLLITAMQPGKTMVRYWNDKGEERACEVTVLPPELFEQFGERAFDDVVKISLEFLEMDGALSRHIGIRWPDAIHFSAGGSLFGDGATTGLNYSATFSSAQGWIQHLVHEGWANILANPDIYVRLGEEASFHSGGEFPVPTSSENYGRYQRHIEWKPFGITVAVRPRSGDRFHISSDIHVEISELNSSVSVEGIPSITKRNLDTKMNSRDGETVVLSGLLRQVQSEISDSVPVLSAIPLLGPWLFSNSHRTRENSEILMAMTFSLSTQSRDRERLDGFRERFRGEGR